jgi:hypothetical protein
MHILYANITSAANIMRSSSTIFYTVMYISPLSSHIVTCIRARFRYIYTTLASIQACPVAQTKSRLVVLLLQKTCFVVTIMVL